MGVSKILGITSMKNPFTEYQLKVFSQTKFSVDVPQHATVLNSNSNPECSKFNFSFVVWCLSKPWTINKINIKFSSEHIIVFLFYLNIVFLLNLKRSSVLNEQKSVCNMLMKSVYWDKDSYLKFWIFKWLLYFFRYKKKVNMAKKNNIKTRNFVMLISFLKISLANLLLPISFVDNRLQEK